MQYITMCYACHPIQYNTNSTHNNNVIEDTLRLFTCYYTAPTLARCFLSICLSICPSVYLWSFFFSPSLQSTYSSSLSTTLHPSTCIYYISVSMSMPVCMSLSFFHVSLCCHFSLSLSLPVLYLTLLHLYLYLPVSLAVSLCLSYVYLSVAISVCVSIFLLHLSQRYVCLFLFLCFT